MIVQRMTDIHVCDFCGENACDYNKCLECNKIACWECRKSRFVSFDKHCLEGSSSIFCADCDSAIRTGAKSNAFHTALLTVANLKRENNAYYEDWHKRAQQADNIVDRLEKALK